METLEDDTFPMGETVSDVWQIVTRITAIHIRASPGRHAEVIAAMLC
jgi:hypothetical protein